MKLFDENKKIELTNEYISLFKVEGFELLSIPFSYERLAQRVSLKHIKCGTIFNVLLSNFKHRNSRCPNNECLNERRKNTNIEKYGCENVFQNEEIQQRSKHTNILKYGVEFSQQNKEIRDKGKKTNLERYGVENVFSLQENKDKCMQACKDNIEEIKIKRKNTFLGRYGVTSFPLSKEFIEKTKQTNLAKFGVEWCQQNKAIKNKSKQTSLKKYGFEFPIQAKEIRNKSSQTKSENIVNGVYSLLPNNKFYKHGYYFSTKINKEMRHRSSWEKQVFEILDNDNTVSSFVNEPFFIEYQFEDNKHRYIPDLLITYKTGQQKLVEIKPTYLLTTDKNQCKFKAAQEYCQEKDLIFEVWTEKEIGKKLLCS